MIFSGVLSSNPHTYKGDWCILGNRNWIQIQEWIVKNGCNIWKHFKAYIRNGIVYVAWYICLSLILHTFKGYPIFVDWRNWWNLECYGVIHSKILLLKCQTTPFHSQYICFLPPLQQLKAEDPLPCSVPFSYTTLNAIIIFPNRIKIISVF